MTQIDGEHFYLKADKGTFSEAKDTCADDYMVLAPVTTYEEYDRLMRANVIGEQTGKEQKRNVHPQEMQLFGSANALFLLKKFLPSHETFFPILY